MNSSAKAEKSGNFPPKLKNTWEERVFPKATLSLDPNPLQCQGAELAEPKNSFNPYMAFSTTTLSAQQTTKQAWRDFSFHFKELPAQFGVPCAVRIKP